MSVFVHSYDYRVHGIPMVEMLFTTSPTHPHNHFGKADWQTVSSFVAVFNQTPSKNRSYNKITKVWTFADNAWDVILKILATVTVIEHSGEYADLNDWMQNPVKVKAAPKTEIPKPEDFFHAPAPTARLTVSAQDTLKRILAIDAIPSTYAELRTLYRRAALQLHPDRNGGDGSKLADLNIAYDAHCVGMGWR